MISVQNYKTYHGSGINIMRPTVFGNPFVLTAECMRDQVLQEYEQYLIRQLDRKRAFYRKFMELVVQYQHTRSLVFVCCCAPKACHGDILARYIIDYAGVDDLI